MPRVFSVIKVNNRNLNAIVDGIRLLANPNEKQVAHITIRGPYNQRYTIDDDVIRGSYIELKGVGTFFEGKQNTIFLKCESPHLKEVWKKSDYPFNPHLTLYDGSSRDFAEKLLSIFKSYKFNLKFTIDKLEYINSIPKQGSNNFAYEYDWKQLSYYLKESITYPDLLSYTENERLIRIEKLAAYFNNWKEISSYPSPINGVLENLNLNTGNGLFYFSDFNSWEKKFPYRIVRALREIKPYAFFSLFKDEHSDNLNHPHPFNQPLILFFDNPSTEHENKIHRQVFSFGQAPIIFIDRLNSLEIYNGFVFENNGRNNKLLEIGKKEQAIDFSFNNLLTGHAWEKIYQKSFHNVRKVDDYLLENLSQARGILIDTFNINPSIANSIIGRLLFVRYLIDRDVEFKKENKKEEDYFPGSDIHTRNLQFLNIIKNPDKLYSFFNYLEQKLNGDLFPVTNEERSVIQVQHLEVLYYLFSGDKPVSTSNNEYVIQKSLFDVYDFKIIPIELISNIYEQFIGRKKREENKSFYTPSFLVDYILSKTVSPFLDKSDKASCKVLDPSCGSGIFLIETLRKLIEKHLSIRNDNRINNDKLWKLVKENIYGIDIDPDAIEVAIFSLYVTVLDYVEPKEISKSFKFEKLKNINFFPEADFFDLQHSFNDNLKDIRFDFILGNPPWGQVDNSAYIDYCIIRERTESIKSGTKVNIGISDKQIAQAFLVRVSDFLNSNTNCALVVTSKVLYNTNAKTWRNYFLSKFMLHEVFELSAVNTKIFNGANWPSAILFYSPLNKNENNFDNIIHHISIKPNKFFSYFKTIIVEKFDYKKIPQKYFLESKGGHDWLWKVLLYGNILDFYFINRLKQDYKTIQEVIDINKLDFGVGLKRKDSAKSQDASYLIGTPFLDTGIKDLTRYSANPSKKWTEKAAAVIPQGRDNEGYPILFRGPLALIKEGLDAGYKGVAAFCSHDIVFTHSVRAIKGNRANVDILKSIVGLINSELFAYYIFMTGTSTGIDFIRANQIEQFSFPAAIDRRYGRLIDVIQKKVSQVQSNMFNNDLNVEIRVLEKQLENLIKEKYEINEIENDLIEYAQTVSIPLTKISDAKKAYRALRLNEPDKQYISDYISVYIEHYSVRLLEVGKYIKVEVYLDNDVVGINFLFLSESPENIVEFNNCQNALESIKTLFNLSFHKLSNELYIQRDVKGFLQNSFYVIKPNEYKNWHKAIARLDLAEFVDAIIKSGAKKQRLSK
ncbi:MAG: N-6 DNA methylase [Bacteroidetes bacterium]|nr:N-6 DNA methylase [Bacteroidota bacterium]